MHYSLKRATLWNILGYVYLIIAALIATPIIIRSLGLFVFGQYSLIIATLALVSAFDLGLPQAVVRALAKEYKPGEPRRTLWATSSLLFILTGLLAGLLAVILTLFLHFSISIYLLIFTLGLMNNLVNHYLTLPQAEGHFGYFNTKTFIVGTGNTLFTAYLAWRGQGMLIILAGMLFTYLLTLLPLAYFSLKFFPHPRAGKASGAVAKSLVDFGLKNQAGKIIGQAQSQYGKYLLAGLAPLSLSAYIVAQGLVQKLAGGVTQVATALYPASARSSGHLSLKSTYRSLQLGLFVLALIGIGIYHVVGLPFLSWWLHAPQLVIVVDQVMKVFVWYFAVLVLNPLACTLLDSHGRPELTSLFALLTTVLEIGLALALFPHYQFMAPVIAALAAAVITTPALLIVTERVIKVK